MVEIRGIEISKEDYEKSKEKGAASLISDSIKMGYGLYMCRTYEANGRYYLDYDRGDSCD